VQTFTPLSQYLCSNCGSILKETTALIEQSLIIEDCPNCGARLADTLKKATMAEQTPALIPTFQTAYDLTRFSIDLEKIRKLLPLSDTGSLCITGYKANLLLTRICIRSLLPANHGGLGSPYAVVVDASNMSDFYQAVDYVKQYGLDLESTLNRIIVSRTFTIYQLKSLLQRELPKVIEKYRPSVVIVPGLLDLFDDPNIKKKEAKAVIMRIIYALKKISDRRLVIASLSENKYSDIVTQEFGKRITLKHASRNTISADIYNGKHNKVTLSERELKLVNRR
jgi:hypothetical protein